MNNNNNNNIYVKSSSRTPRTSAARSLALCESWACNQENNTSG